ncbi:hypothetical protein A2619_02150 [candidate division WWE3 bacterium RIFOXYD1_FULL_39_9]|uniref:ABC transporter domain-containing protein n=1 Tax=candidate division WWE3 bacterium RIFOXYD1_FULL_39_9 TaxID=1802649 RepID=A0A1F4X371_UNCKA|nr:MAG: hypothetical protein A2619_02150 [candidate division WWE3 bacterium RIFOXYD1_FULL_39_9]
MIEVKNISKSFDDIKAVDDLSFSIKNGEVVGLLGPNGAGKTTTMRIMTGFFHPDAGDVLVNGISIKKDSIGALKLIGYLPENNPLYKDMIVSDFLKYSASLKGIKNTDLKDALDFVVKSANLSKVFYRPISELSKGFKQRVGIASALIHKPEIVIMDEPTEGLDPSQRVEIRDLIKELSINHTVLISTHVLQEVESMCSRIVIINKGQKVGDGSISEISKSALNVKTIFFEVEGKKVESQIKKLNDIREVKFTKVSDDRYKVELIVDFDSVIQPALFDLAKENNWKVWELTEKGHNLEEIFKQLTR